MDDKTIEARESQQRSGVGRRSVLAAAWSVPAISVLAPSPAFAASPPKPLFGSGQSALSRPDVSPSKQIKFGWTLNNPAGNLAATSISVAVSMFKKSTITPTPSQISAGGSTVFTFDCEEHDASGDGAALDNFLITVNCKFGTDTQLHTYTWTVSAGSVSGGGTKTVSLTGGVAGGTDA